MLHWIGMRVGTKTVLLALAAVIYIDFRVYFIVKHPSSSFWQVALVSVVIWGAVFLLVVFSKQGTKD